MKQWQASRWQRWGVGLTGALVALLVSVELALRWGWGLGNPPLLQADPAMGYRFRPNQDLQRFGNRIRYNRYSQRSAALLPRSPERVRILLTGDSVLNGGARSDQSETIDAYMTAQWAAAGQAVETLNASASSWGIGNQLGYLETFGLFDSDLLIVTIGAHDLVQPTSTSELVGRHPSYPNRKPWLALQEAWTRYAWPRLQLAWWRWRSRPTLAPPPEAEQAAQFRDNMQSLAAIVKLARAREIPLLVVYLPDLVEVWGVAVESPYKAELLAQLQRWAVPVADAETAWEYRLWREVEPFYRDSVHLTREGNQAVAQLVIARLCWDKALPDRQHRQLCS